MRQTARAALSGAVALAFLMLTMFMYHRDDWRQHLERVTYNPPTSLLEEPRTESAINAVTRVATGSPSPKPPLPIETFKPDIQDEQDKPVAVAPFSKAVVMARLSSEDTAWAQAELPDWAPYIYTVNDQSAALHTTKNKGRESLAYLTYLVENYHNLSDTIAFIHSHKDGYPQAWHTDNSMYSNVASLQSLQIPYVQEQGYANLRCNGEIGCKEPEMQMNRQPKQPHRTAELALPNVWNTLMGENATLPDTIATPCCAQFAVSKAQVLKRPLEEYRRYQRWVLETDLADDVAGRIMEYLWHIMFGRKPVFCPDVSSCYCDVYGQCDT